VTPDVDIAAEGAVTVVRIEGDVDAARAGRLRPAVLEAVAPHMVAVLLDLTGVDFLDSGGVHLLVDLHRDLTRRGYAVHLVRPARRTPSLVLDVTDVGAAIALHPDRASAVAAIDPDPGY
jgi:anti-sigma B factor antagonist